MLLTEHCLFVLREIYKAYYEIDRTQLRGQSSNYLRVVGSNPTVYLFFSRENRKAFYENIKMFGGIFMNLKLLGVIITIGGAVLSLADQNLKDKKMEEMIKKEVDKQVNKK